MPTPTHMEKSKVDTIVKSILKSVHTDAATEHRQEGGIFVWLVEAVRTRRLHQLQTHTQYAAAAPTTGPFYPLGP